VKHFYKGHDLQVNTERTGTIVYDVFNRSRQHLLAGFSLTEPNEQTVMDRMKARVDQFILEPPVRTNPS